MKQFWIFNALCYKFRQSPSCIANILEPKFHILSNYYHILISCNQRYMSCKSESLTNKPKTTLVSLEEARRFMKDCFTALCVPDDNAEMVASMLSEADHNGHYSHGMNRLEWYLNNIENNIVNKDAKPKLIKETEATAWCDGCNGLGAVIGITCMKMAIEKAKKVGIGCVAVRASNHYGMQRYYMLMAIKEGLIGLTTTNTNPLMVPTRCTQPLLGTNPIAFGAPAINNDNFVLDMATTTVSVGKIEMQVRKGEPIPPGWALDKDGKPTTDSKKALDAKLLLPLGGKEETAGYKGSGLAAMIDIMSGVLSGANFLNKIQPRNLSKSGTYNLGHLFMAINPDCFAPGFKERQSEFNSIFRNCKPLDSKNPVQIPGDMEIAQMKEIDKIGGLSYTDSQMTTCNALAQRLQVEPLKSKKN